jgi:hypothetical protein
MEARGGRGETGGNSIDALGGNGIAAGGTGVHAVGGPGRRAGGAGAVLLGGEGDQAGAGLVVSSGQGRIPSPAIQANGDVVSSGTTQSSAMGFTILNPLDPALGTLSHSATYSPDMKTIYDGIVETDDGGNATVVLPDYFEALNQDFRYQLTSIGGPAPGLCISAEITNNQFQISGGIPHGKVSWQVTGIRRDAYALRNPIQPEEPRRASEALIRKRADSSSSQPEASMAEKK